MPRCGFRQKKVLIFLLIFGLYTKCGDTQIVGNDVPKVSDEQVKEGDNAFYALRSCHQVLHGDSGEFFSPDYLCSNPPLWCNWTVQVDPQMRVHLYLEDLSPSDVCHLKRDQIHVDEPAGYHGGHKILLKCWREAKFVSVSNTLHVVLLIGGSPGYPYRGFYGRYQAFGPPAVYNPHDQYTQQNGRLWMETAVTETPLSGERGFTEFSPKSFSEQMDSVLLERPTLPSPANDDPIYDYYDQPSSMPVLHHGGAGALPEWDSPARVPSIWEEEEGFQVHSSHHQSSPSHGDYELTDDLNHFTAAPDMATSAQGTVRTGRRAAQNQSEASGKAVRSPSSPPQHYEGPDTRPSFHSPTAMRRDTDAQSQEDHLSTTVTQDDSSRQDHVTEVTPGGSSERIDAEGNDTRTSESPSSSVDNLLPFTEKALPRAHPSVVEQLSDPRTNGDARNHTEFAHVPGDPLFEVAVEVNFLNHPDDHWDHIAWLLLLSVKSLISNQLDIIHTPKYVLPKRIKRLSAGVLYILWLQMAEGAPGGQVHRTLHTTLQELIEMSIDLEDGQRRAVIVSVSTADVYECGTHLMLCDLNAECVNRFGSYSCHCRLGFQDVSRLASGGTLYVDAKTSGCGASTEITKVVYVMFFLLGSLVLTLLVAVAVMYRRHHRGAFLVRCPSGDFYGAGCPKAANEGGGGNGSVNADLELPPPPPIRRPKEGWSHPKECCPHVDLPLLHFNPILPLDGYIDPPEDKIGCGGKL